MEGTVFARPLEQGGAVTGRESGPCGWSMVKCKGGERAGQVGQTIREPPGHGESFAMDQATHGFFPSSLANPLCFPRFQQRFWIHL